MSIYHGITPDSDSVILVTGFAATETTREQMREELARAMGWTLCHHGYGISPDAEVVPQPRQLPNPFTSAADSRALVAWLALPENWRIWNQFFDKLKHLVDIESTWIDGYTGPVYSSSDVKAIMTAPLPVIAEAAWQAIQEK